MITEQEVVRWLFDHLEVDIDLADAIYRDYKHLYPLPYSSADTLASLRNWLVDRIERMESEIPA